MTVWRPSSRCCGLGHANTQQSSQPSSADEFSIEKPSCKSGLGRTDIPSCIAYSYPNVLRNIRDESPPCQKSLTTPLRCPHTGEPFAFHGPPVTVPSSWHIPVTVSSDSGSDPQSGPHIRRQWSHSRRLQKRPSRHPLGRRGWRLRAATPK